MPAFGYAKRMIDAHGLHELREVTLSVTSAEMRRIAAFLLDCADRSDSGEWRNSHRHLDGFDRATQNNQADFDLVVMNPLPDPPQRISEL